MREIRIEGEVAYVPLTLGYVAVIDAADVPLIDGVSWCAKVFRKSDGSIRVVYAARVARLGGGRRRTVYLHRIISGEPDGLEVDHIDCDGMNNRRSNLRTATKAQNQHNQRLSIVNTSGAKGVRWRKQCNAWQASIRINGRRIVSSHPTKEQAIAARAKFNTELHGEFGRAE